MNFRTTIVLLCVLIAVGSIVAVTQYRGLSSSSEKATPKNEKLFNVTAGDLTKIGFTDDTGQQITLEKNDFKWSLTSPVKGPAEDSAVTSLITALTDADERGTVEANASTGLNSPAHHVELTTKNNLTIAFDVGSRSATGEVVYIKRSGQTQADVVSSSLADALDKPLKDWRRAKLLDVAATEIKQLRIASTQPTLQLDKLGDNWQMAGPTTEPVDAIAVSDLTSAAANLRAAEFVSDSNDSAAQYGLDHPVLTVTFNTAGMVVPPATAPASIPAPTTITFGRYSDVLRKNVYVEVSTQPGIFEVAAFTLSSFRKTPLELRDKKLITIAPADVTGIEITKNQAATTQPTTKPAMDRTIVLKLRDAESKSASTQPTTNVASTSQPSVVATTMAATTSASTMPETMAATAPASAPASKWIIASSNDAAADDEKIATMLGNFNPLRVERFEETAGTEKPLVTYTVRLHRGERADTFTLADAGGTLPFRGEYDGLNFVLSREMIDAFDSDFVKSATPQMPSGISPQMPSGMSPMTPPGAP